MRTLGHPRITGLGLVSLAVLALTPGVSGDEE